MKHSVFRGFLLGCFAMLAAVFTLAMPASASTERIFSGYELSAPDLVVLDPIIAPDVAILAEGRSEPERPHAVSSIDPGPIAPEYLMSWRTDGRSLAEYHLRL